jgi:sodium transport system ATP-binding protein
MNAQRHAIEVRNVTRSYGDVRAVDHVNFDVRYGEVVGLLGPNGAGKTTMLRMIATLIPPDEGQVRVAGHDTHADSLGARRSLGYQTGDTGLYARLTPREFLSYFAVLGGLPDIELPERVDALIDEFGIGDFADRLCGNLSTGQKQRVSLARTLLTSPRVLVFDEPTSGLDIVSSSFVLDTLRRFAAEGRAVLFSTHVMSEVELICDRVLLLHRGQLLASDTVAGLMRSTGREHFARAFLDLIERADAPSTEPSPTGGTP